jgi:HEAT repeat protein
VLCSAAEADPGTVEPVVPALVALLDQWRSASAPVVETLAVVASDDPDAVASTVPALVSCAEERPGEIESAAIRALAELGAVRPSAVRPAVPVLTDHLAGEEPEHREMVAEALVAIAAHHPDERDRMARVLSDVHGIGRLRAARALAATGTEAGATAAETAVGDGSLERYLASG